MTIKRVVNERFDFKIEMDRDEMKNLSLFIEYGLDHCREYGIKNEQVIKFGNILDALHCIIGNDE